MTNKMEQPVFVYQSTSDTITWHIYPDFIVAESEHEEYFLQFVVQWIVHSCNAVKLHWIWGRNSRSSEGGKLKRRT